MTDQAAKPDLLRIVSAILLGCIVGVILFLIFALGIGMLNDRMHMELPINLLVAENIFSAAILAILVIVCIAAFLRMVWNTPPSEPVRDEDEEGP